MAYVALGFVTLGKKAVSGGIMFGSVIFYYIRLGSVWLVQHAFN
jgi:hypothetical protein